MSSARANNVITNRATTGFVPSKIPFWSMTRDLGLLPLTTNSMISAVNCVDGGCAIKSRRKIKVVLSEMLPFHTEEQYRFPRSKKNRINKKWRKNANNWRVEAVHYLMIDGVLVLSGNAWTQLQQDERFGQWDFTIAAR